MCILEPHDRACSDVKNAGLFITATPYGFHSGFLYTQNNATRAVHLAFHYRLNDDIPGPSYRWVQIGLDEDNSLVLSGLLSRIGNAGSLIPYGFDASGCCFDAHSGELISPLEIGKGLTCATFITSVLNTYGYNLLLIDSWPERPDDVEWQRDIVLLLAKYASAEHVKIVEGDIGKVRLRPHEAVAAGAVDGENWPLSYEMVSSAAEQVVFELITDL
ncbi:MAG: hypothetical protein K2P80_08100 [Beijerinckiaceae bacterium]|nr:hypothetical protein [Beijerinckiaceae bacterium]